jgi:hypothetical protein
MSGREGDPDSLGVSLLQKTAESCIDQVAFFGRGGSSCCCCCWMEWGQSFGYGRSNGSRLEIKMFYLKKEIKMRA